MGTSNRIVAVMGSHRRGGVIDAVVHALLESARSRGADVDKIDLLDCNIEFCRNCRCCSQDEGTTRGLCVVDDDVGDVLDRLRGADAIVLAASVNFGDVNARMRQLLERMIGLGYWPWGAKFGPVLRDKQRGKRAVLITASAAPAFLTRILGRPLRSLRQMARLLGARPVDQIIVGMVTDPAVELPTRTHRAVERAARRIVTA